MKPAWLYVFLAIYSLFHFFGHTLQRVNLLKWKHLLEKYPQRFTVVARLGENVNLIKAVIDLYRFVFFAAAMIFAVSLLGVRDAAIGTAVYFLIITFVTGLFLRGEGAEKALLFLFPLMKIFLVPLFPFISAASHDKIDLDQEEEPTDEEVSAYITLGKDEGFIEPMEEELIQSVVAFSDTLVREVMTPRTDMVVAKADDSWNDLVRAFMTSRHSRIPVIGENLDDVLGVVHVKDCLEIVYGNQMDKPLQTIIRNPWFVPETKRLFDLLTEMRESHQHMAIVVDEYGGTAGLVTLEDLLEEIVGDIADEHEDDESEVVELSSGVFSLDGKAHVDVLDDLFDLSIEDASYDTIGGLLVTVLGQVPEPGAVHVHRGIRFEVTDSDNRRVRRVTVSRANGGVGSSAEP